MAFENIGVVFDFDICLFFFIGFVIDFSYDFFQNVFHGDNTRRAPVFIYDNSQMYLLGLEFFQQVVNFLVSGTK